MAQQSLAVWTIAADGSSEGRRLVDRGQLREHVAHTLAGGHIVVLGRLDVIGDLRELWRESNGSDRRTAASIDVRPLTGPHVVPDGWTQPIGAPGQIAGRLAVVDGEEGND